MKDYFTKKELIIILVIVLVAIFTLGFRFILKDMADSKKQPLEIIKESHIEDTSSPSLVEEEYIMIHISGQVYDPGLFELKSGSRVKDAVDLAGGLKKDADVDRINLAKKIADEEKIYIPQKGEDIDIEIEASNLTTSTSSNSKININNCSKEELISLPGVGEVTASKIIDYRSTNKFKVIDDLMNVSGIGTKKFEAIKDFVIVK